MYYNFTETNMITFTTKCTIKIQNFLVHTKKPPFRLRKEGRGEDCWYQGLAQPTIVNNLTVHALMVREHSLVGRL